MIGEHAGNVERGRLARHQGTTMGITSDLIDRIDAMTRAGAPDDARTAARHCLLDWFGCAIVRYSRPSWKRAAVHSRWKSTS